MGGKRKDLLGPAQKFSSALTLHRYFLFSHFPHFLAKKILPTKSDLATFASPKKWHELIFSPHHLFPQKRSRNSCFSLRMQRPLRRQFRDFNRLFSLRSTVSLRGKCEEKKITFFLLLERQIPPRFYVIPLRVESVLRNRIVHSSS